MSKKSPLAAGTKVIRYNADRDAALVGHIRSHVANHITSEVTQYYYFVEWTESRHGIMSDGTYYANSMEISMKLDRDEFELMN